MTQKTVQARYKPSVVPEFAGNPLIEALVPALSPNNAMIRMRRRCEFYESERALDDEARLQMLARLRGLVVPLPGFAQIHEGICSMVRSGYQSRNPLSQSGRQDLYKQIADDGQYDIAECDDSAGIELGGMQMAVVGLSGMGKTTVVRMALSCLGPPIIEHTGLAGGFTGMQITRLLISAPEDGTPRSLALAFFAEVDRLTKDTDYAAQYSDRRIPLATLKSAMRQIAATYFIGVLVVDEIQMLSARKSQGFRRILNFFLTLMNQLQIPILLVGTPAAEPLFADRLQDARRAADSGYHYFWRPESWKDENWTSVVKAFWSYQWVRNPAPLTDEIREVLFDLTAGVTAVLRVLMIAAQKHAILHGIEVVDAAVLKEVYKVRLSVLHKAIDLIRRPKHKKTHRDLALLDDLFNSQEVREILESEKALQVAT